MAEDNDCRPVFKLVPVENKAKSRESGRPIYEEREYVEIIIPGSRNERPVRKVQEADKDRWPREYAAFQRNHEQTQEGTPLEQWPRMTRSRVYELKAVGVFSVEDLAALSDQNLANIGPDARELRDNAKAFLGSDPGEVQELRARIEELEAENAELRRNQKAKPGRKPKSEAA